MYIYNYDSVTGEYLGESIPQRDPRGGGYLVPAFATEMKPPEFGDFETVVFFGGVWHVKTDYRGVELFDTNTGLMHYCQEIGIDAKSLGYTTIRPECDFPKWDGSGWKPDANAKKAFDDQVEKSQLIGYLASTDWYVARMQETGKKIPVDITKERQAARDRISKINEGKK